jgi:hypothetical protein
MALKKKKNLVMSSNCEQPLFDHRQFVLKQMNNGRTSGGAPTNGLLNP